MMPEPNPGMPAAGGTPVPIAYLPMDTQPEVYDKFLSETSIVTGRGQIVIGVLCIVFNIISLAVSYELMGSVGHGIWGGAMFIVTGSFGIAAGKRRTKCPIIAYMVLCIISASFTAALIALGIMGAVSSGPTGTAMQSLIVIAAVLEAIFSIRGAVICCKSGACCISGDGCCCEPDPTTDIPGGFVPNNAQLIYISQTQGRQCVYLPQPVMGYPSGSGPPPPPNDPNSTQIGWYIPPSQSQASGIPSAQTNFAPGYTAEYPGYNTTADDTVLLWP